MKLRARIALTTLVAMVPLVAAIGGLMTLLRAQTMDEGVMQFAQAVASSSRVACEQAPVGWGGPVNGGSIRTAGPEVYAYDELLRSQHPSAPPLPPHLIAGAQAGAPRMIRRDDRIDVLVRAAGSGPCAFLLVRRPPMVRPGPTMALPGLVVLVCALLVLGVVLALLGPIVRKIHRLRDEVLRSAASGYREEVTVRGDDELADLAAAFVASGRQIAGHIDAQARRERTLREFLANTTHDVMLPLTVLKGHLAALHASSAADPAATIRAAMQEADYIASLVHNLEIAARLDAGEPEVARYPVELVPLVARVISRHTPLARRREVELVHAVPAESPLVIGDVTLIEQAISNLVQNAVLHNRAGGHVAVILEMEDAQRFRVAIVDDGPGMTEDELARVLDRGERGDAARVRHPHGKGLGLAIARRVIAAHGWEFGLRAPPEGGLSIELIGAVATGEQVSLHVSADMS